MFVCESKITNSKATYIMSIVDFYYELEKSKNWFLIKEVNSYLYDINFRINLFDIKEFMKRLNFYENEKEEIKKRVKKALNIFHLTMSEKYDFCKEGIFEFPVREPRNSNNASLDDILYTSALYYILEIKSRGNQWTMIKKSEMKFYKKYDFIELFASPFNSRTNRYCSLFESDKVFGSLGDNRIFIEKMISGKLYHKFLLFSPPSGLEINLKMAENILELLSGKIFHIILVISCDKKYKKPIDMLVKNKYFVKKKINIFCYDFFRKMFIDMRKRPWLWIYLTNDKNKLKIPDFPKESPYE